MSAGQPVVYRVYDKTERLIYIGSTANAEQRLAAHRSRAWWWPIVGRVTYESHPDIQSALDAEWAAIAAEGPEFNLAMRRGRPSSKPVHLDAADAQLCRDWLTAKRGRGLPMPLRWVRYIEDAA